MLSAFDGGESMAGAFQRIASRLDDAFNLLVFEYAGWIVVTNVVPSRQASEIEFAENCSWGQPTRRSAAFAFETSKSAMQATLYPWIRGTWAKCIDPNFPAPISPTRIGRPLNSCRFASSECKFNFPVPAAEYAHNTLRRRTDAN